MPARLAARPVPHSPVFAVVGRVVRERGIDVLIDALIEVHGDWRLRIIGTGPEQEKLEARAQTVGLSSRIEWMGGLPREALTEMWPEIDVLIAPSRVTSSWVEPTGSVVLDGMAHAVPAVVSNSGALPDVVAGAGMIIEEGDREALSRALQGLVSTPARCRVLGNAARQRVVEHYGDGPIAERMVAWWRQVLATATRSGVSIVS
jgi:glycosyltransferase involved in cell wall biosynthesis